MYDPVALYFCQRCGDLRMRVDARTGDVLPWSFEPCRCRQDDVWVCIVLGGLVEVEP